MDSLLWWILSSVPQYFTLQVLWQVVTNTSIIREIKYGYSACVNPFKRLFQYVTSGRRVQMHIWHIFPCSGPSREVASQALPNIFYKFVSPSDLVPPGFSHHLCLTRFSVTVVWTTLCIADLPVQEGVQLQKPTQLDLGFGVVHPHSAMYPLPPSSTPGAACPSIPSSLASPHLLLASPTGQV